MEAVVSRGTACTRGSRATAGIALGMVLFVSNLGAQPLPQGDPTELGFDPVRLERARGVIRRLVAADSLPGAVVMVARHGQVVAAFAEGFADLERRTPLRLDHIFRLASQSKVLVSAAGMSLFEDDYFFLDQPVSDVLPDFTTATVFDGEVTRPANSTLTVRDLFRHTCGYEYRGALEPLYRSAGLMTDGREADWTHPFTLQEWGTRLAAVSMDAEPGTKFEYGLCHDLLGLFIEAVSGQRLDEVLQERVIGPLSLRDTGFWFDDERIDRLVNVYDMSSGSAVLAGLPSEDSFWPGVGFGLGSAVVYDAARYGEPTSRGTIWWGGSLGTSFWVDPVEEIVGVVMVQVRPFGYARVADRVQKAIYAALVDEPPLNPGMRPLRR